MAWFRLPAPKTETSTLLTTTMPNPHLPPELLDQISDLLHDTRSALKNCCLVSKSWIPRTRRHLFADVVFHTTENLQSWKTTFPDPSTSPACYTRFLHVDFPQFITAEDVKGGGWIQTFSQVVHLEIGIPRTLDAEEPELSLIPFHGFSPALGSLHVTFTDLPPSLVSDLIHSFPRLRDLAVASRYRFSANDYIYQRPVAIQPSTPLAFTGSLRLSLLAGMNAIVPRLLSQPGGLHFRELRLTWHHEEDVLLTAALVERCSPTLETLNIECELGGATVWNNSCVPTND